MSVTPRDRTTVTDEKLMELYNRGLALLEQVSMYQQTIAGLVQSWSTANSPDAGNYTENAVLLPASRHLAAAVKKLQRADYVMLALVLGEPEIALIGDDAAAPKEGTVSS